MAHWHVLVCSCGMSECLVESSLLQGHDARHAAAHQFLLLQIIWVMKHSHIGDAFFDRDAAEYLLGQLREPEAGSRPFQAAADRYSVRRPPC